jgi:hypothetical protein
MRLQGLKPLIIYFSEWDWWPNNMGYIFSRNNLITRNFQFIRPTTKHLRIRLQHSEHCSIASKLQKYFLVIHLAHLMVRKMLKLMKKLTSYALWKWRGWFAKIKHNNSVCVFEFKLFVHCSITFDIQFFKILLLAHPIL